MRCAELERSHPGFSRREEKRFKAAVVTISDRSYRGERVDLSGDVACSIIENAGISVVRRDVIPDEFETIRSVLIELCEQGVELIVTTGGTGLSPRDVTPEATLDILEREIPGMAEAMRAESLKISPHAMISRAVCGMRGKTIIVNLPGSPKAVKDCLEIVMKAIPHALEVASGQVTDCVREQI